MFVIYNRCAAHCNRELSMESRSGTARMFARAALALLLTINLFNYIDGRDQRRGLESGERLVGNGDLIRGSALHQNFRRHR